MIYQTRAVKSDSIV